MSARVGLAKRDAGEAVEALRCEPGGARVFGPWSAAAYLARVDACLASDDPSGARASLVEGRGALEAHAALIADPALRERHLRGVPEHARLLAATVTRPGARR